MLPDVGSTIVPPGRRRPSRSAASISETATRSLIEPPGLSDSTFATSCGVRPAPRRDSRTSGVSPIASRIESRMSACGGARCACSCRQCATVRSNAPYGRRISTNRRSRANIRHEARHCRACRTIDSPPPRRHRPRDPRGAQPRTRASRTTGSPSGWASPRRRACSACARCARAACCRASTPKSTSRRSAGRCRRWSPCASTVHQREEIEDFTRAVRELPGVLSVFHVDGRERLPRVGRGGRRAGPARVRRRPSRDAPSVAHAETSLIYEHRRGPGPWRNRNARPPDLQS